MTALVSSSLPSQPQTTENPFISEIKSTWRWCVKVYHDHSDLISQLSLWTLNSVILVGRIFQETIPAYITRGAYVLMSFTGVIWMNMQFRDLIKTVEDLWRGIQAKDFEAIFFTATKVTVKGLNILLTTALLGASILSLCGLSHISLIMYGIMLPFSMFSLFVGIGNDVYDYQKNEYLLGRVKKIEKASDNDQQIQKMMKNFLNQLNGKKTKNRLSRHLYQQMNHFTLEMFREQLKKRDSIDDAYRMQLYKGVREALEQKQTYTKTNLGLIALGYVCMGICKIWPETLIQASVTWGISSLYTSRKIYQKIKHAKLENLLEP